jgi:hypothetical protein
VRLTVFNMLGRRVADLTDAPFDEGVHRVTFDGSHLPSGVYLAQLEAGALRATTKLVLVK